MNARIVMDGIDFGEGPRWHDGRLWFSDFYQSTIRVVTPDGHIERTVRVPGQPSGLGWLPDGDLLIVSMLDRRILRWDTRAFTQHAELSAVATWHCNDMVVSATGHAYVGNFGWDLDGGGEPCGAALAHVSPDGTVEVGATDLMFPNGSVLTPDGSTLIVGETMGARYTAFAIDDDGHLGAPRLWAEVPDTLPDGCCLDAEGGIWFANAGSAEVVRVVEGGEITDRREVSQGAYACMLGGANGTTLFVLTCSGSNPRRVAGKRTGRLEAVEVGIAHAGLP